MRLLNHLSIALFFILMISISGCGGGSTKDSTEPIDTSTSVLSRATIDVGGIQLVGISSSGKKIKKVKEEDEYLRSNCVEVSVYKLDGTFVGSAEQDALTKKWKIDLSKTLPYIIKAKIKGKNGNGSFFSERILKSSFSENEDIAVNDDTSKVYSRVVQVALYNDVNLVDIEGVIEDEITDAEKTIESIINGTFLDELVKAIDSNKTDSEKAEIIKAGLDELTALLAIFNELDKRFAQLELGETSENVSSILPSDFEDGGALDILTLTDANSTELSTEVNTFISNISAVINIKIFIVSNQISIKNADNIDLLDPDSVTISLDDLKNIQVNNAVPSLVINGLIGSTLEVRVGQSLNFLVETRNAYANSVFTVVVQDESILTSVLSNTSTLKFSEILKITGLKAGSTLVTIVDSANKTKTFSFTVIVKSTTDHTKPLLRTINLITNEDALMLFDLNNLLINSEAGLNYEWDANQNIDTKGVITISGNLLTYTPKENVNGLDSFNIKVNNGFEDSDFVAIKVSIISINDTPVLVSQDLSTNENESVTLDLTLLGTDPDKGQQLAFLLSSSPTNGTASITNNILTYTPKTNFSGSDTLSITINDGFASSNAVTFPITVLSITPLPNAPVISSITANDPDDADGVFSNQDTFTIIFNVPTNQPVVAAKANLDNIFTFSQSLGSNYTGIWSDSSTLVITMVDTTGNGAPMVGTFKITVKAAGGLKDSTGKSLASTSTSSVLVGDFGIFTASPNNVSAASGDGQVTITWASVVGATSYNLYFSNSTGVTKVNSKITGVTSPYIHSNLTNGTGYFYVITAVSSSVESAVSTEANATPVAVPTVPSVPTLLSAVKGDLQNVITWSPSSGATSFNLYFSTSSGVTTFSTKLASVTSPYTHIGLTNGTTYFYVVTAVNAVGESGISAEANATPEIPSTLPVININDPLPYQNNYIEFTYVLSDAENDICTINAEYSIDSGINWLTATLIGTTSNLAPGLDTKSILWNMKSDLNITTTVPVLLKLRATDTNSGAYDTSNGVKASSHNKIILYVDKDNVAPGNGLSWINSFNSVKVAIANTTGNNEIWIADGTYIPGTVKNVDTFNLLAGVEIYGGFNGTESFRYQRNWKVNKTIFSGDINGNSPGTTNDDIYHIVTSQSSGLIDGITLKYGLRGMVNVNGATTIISNCTITNNTNQIAAGGGFYNNDSFPIFINCNITNNTTILNGGGMYNNNCIPVIINCNFSGNSTTGVDGGGGIYNRQSPSTMINCAFTGNTSATKGGGIYNLLCSPKIINCTIAGNNAINIGGGICNESSSDAVITNCIVWGNKINGVESVSMVDEINNITSTPVITYSIVKGITVANGNLDSDPLFTALGSDYTLGNLSPALNTGNNNASLGIDLNGDGGSDGNKASTDLSIDLKENARIKNATIDMGAYEK